MTAHKNFVVEVNEGVVEASRQGVDWWCAFVSRFRGTDRIRETIAPCIIGGTSEVSCDSRQDADELAAYMINQQGFPRSAVRVKPAK